MQDINIIKSYCIINNETVCQKKFYKNPLKQIIKRRKQLRRKCEKIT